MSASEDTSNEEICSLEIAIIRCVLKDTIDEIAIVNKGECKKHDVRPPIKVRFKEKVRRQIFYHPTLQIMKDALMDLIDIKLKRDIDYLRIILTKTYNELKDQGSFKIILKSVKDDQREEEDENEFIFEYIKNTNLLDFFKEKLKRDSEENKRSIKNLDEAILDLENKLHDCRIENGMKNRLVEKWERTRFEQEQVIKQNKEKLLIDNCNHIKRKINIESRAIHDIEVYITHKIQSLENQIEKWKEKYNSEIEKLDNEIQTTREKIIEIKQKNVELNELYATRQIEIDDYWREKTIQREARELEEKKWQCAINLQSWWRGICVRRNLGKFRKKGKGKGKGKKK